MSHPITQSILNAYFPRIYGLQAYLNAVLAPPLDREINDVLLLSTDPPSYGHFLAHSYVAFSSEVPPSDRTRFTMTQASDSMRAVITQAQESLFSGPKQKGANIITLGYRSSYQSGSKMRTEDTRSGVNNFFVNTIVTALQEPDWERLLGRIGESAMLHLLTQASIFVPLPNECLCQLTGLPLNFLPSPAIDLANNASTVPVPSGKRKRKASPHPEAPSVKKPFQPLSGSSERGPADILFDRGYLCYGRPAYTPHMHVMAVGLPPKHVLNVLNPSFRQSAKTWRQTRDHHKRMEDARHLSKYIFPREYGLATVFTSAAKAHKYSDFADREDEIKKARPSKTPKRVKLAIDLLEKMIWRHGKCSYWALRDIACPTKVKRPEQEASLDYSIILEIMSEESSCLSSQRVPDTPNPPHEPPSRPTVGGSKAKPRFAEFACSHVEVFRFVALVTKAVIPKHLWGGDENFRKAMSALKNFISYRRYETISLHAIMQGLSTTSCKWTASSNASLHTPTSDSHKRRELFEEFIIWYFGSFVAPLLRTTFYVTESSAFKNKILYFRQDDWDALCAPLIERLTSVTFSKLEEHEAEEILRQRTLGFSFVRLLPKETGVRPIVNLRRKTVEIKGKTNMRQQSINDILQAAFQILTYEKTAKPELVGASVFGHNEIYTRLKSYQTHLISTSSSGSLPKLYFVKVDVQACFDTIEQSKLLQILQDVLSGDNYVLPRYGQVMQAAGRVKRKFAMKALPDDEHPHFLRYATELAAMLRHTIFVDRVVYNFSSKTEVLELLEEHITENIVKIGQYYYRQVVGIPQGSVLSSLLCSIFYADLERTRLAFTQDPMSLVLRLIDDYLFITTDPAKARRFLDAMVEGHPEYGCFISLEKTLTNFECAPHIVKVTEPEQKSFPWCALLINMDNLSVSTDYTRYHDTFIADSLTIDRGPRAGLAFLHKMLQLGRAKSHIIFCDSHLNTLHGVYLNAYQNFLVVAMRMHHYLRSWGANIRKNLKFIHRTIQQVVRYTCAVMRSKALNRVSAAQGGKCEVEKSCVTWLGLTAFRIVLARKPTVYKSLLKLLDFDLSQMRYRRHKKQFRGLVRSGMVMIDQLSF